MPTTGELIIILLHIPSQKLFKTQDLHIITL